MSTLASLILVVSSVLGFHLPSALHSKLDQLIRQPVLSQTEPELPAAPVYAIPARTTPAGTLQLRAASAIAVDLDTAQPLYSLHAEDRRPIASITKLATALVILRTHSLDEIVTVPQLPAYAEGDELIGLTPGEKFKVKDLLAALLVQSANDAADTLAIWHSGSKQAFAAEMNKNLAEWDIKNAHFNNPSGLTDAGNGASAHAVAQISLLLLHNPTAARLIQTQTTTIADTAGKTFTLNTTDDLLQTGRFYGIKTGYTPAAGECFAGLTVINGHRVITVILGSTDRFGDTETLANWIGNNYTWQ